MQNKIIFSTNRSLDLTEKKQEPETLLPAQQTLYLSLERGKGGKVATLIEGFIGTETDLEALGKTLKNKCGTGGTVKDGIILIQGEKREQLIALLQGLGYKTKKKGG
jgi:translation initiation factor 1